ncbi:MAG: hypothetical protein WCO04_18900 [Pseudomonadota bacterium]
MTLQTLENWLASLGPLADWTLAVQRSSLLKVLSHDAESGQARLRRHDGTEFDASWSEMLHDHFPIEGGSYLKPQFHPLRALVMDQNITLDHGGQAVVLTIGSVVLTDNGTPIAVLSHAEYLRDFDIVHPSALADG